MAFTSSSHDPDILLVPNNHHPTDVILRASCKHGYGAAIRTSRISLNGIYGVYNGRFKYGGKNFLEHAVPGSVRMVPKTDYSVYLEAKFKVGDKEIIDRVDVNKHIKNSNGHLVQIRSRVLIVCFDGTTNQYDLDNTNVVKIMSYFKRDDPEAQRVYYQTGIGTYVPPGFISNSGTWLAKHLDSSAGIFLQQHVLGGYRFLSQEYRQDDQICIFGFSRGAYTARALAAMLHKVGLLYPNNDEQAPFAYDMFRNGDSIDPDLVPHYKEQFCQAVQPDFVGVWDTVGSIGLVIPRTLPHVDANESIRIFRHAVSLDEHRVKFTPSLWKQGDPSSPREPGVANTDVKEVWFAGEHCDVGGGAEKDKSPSALSNISLRWMIKEVIESKVGVLFDEEKLLALGLPVKEGKNGRYPPLVLDERKGLFPKDIDDAQNAAINPNFTGLMGMFWRGVEVLPFMRHYMVDDKSRLAILPNFGYPRQLYYSSTNKVTARIHASVKERMDAVPQKGKSKYEPFARWDGYPYMYDVKLEY